MTRLLHGAALLAALVLSLGACGDATDPAPLSTDAPATGSGLVVQDAWVRATTGTGDPSMTGAFMTIDNPGDEAVTLVGAASDVATMVELHEMAMVEGQSVMQRVEGGIEIPAGGGKVLMPGGYHVMLMGLTEELAPGDEVTLTLELSDGTTEELTVPVKAFTEEEPHYHESGDAHPSMSPSPSAG